MSTSMYIFLAIQVTILPIQALLWLGQRRENDKHERILKTSLRALGIIVTTRSTTRGKPS